MPFTITLPNADNASITFERIAVLLGSNGAGKSSALRDVLQTLNNTQYGDRVVTVEGGRTITINHRLRLNRKNFQQYETVEQAEATHKGKVKSTLSSRVFDALMHLDRRGAQLKSEHSDAVEAWNKDGRAGDYPSREVPPLDRVFELFSEIFPHLSLELGAESKAMNVTRANIDAPYPASSLSDGEKQVFSILADLESLRRTGNVFLIDEPELNLNPDLANRLWDTIESEYAESFFVYATHSVSFAMRQSVDDIVVLSANDNSITHIASIHELPDDELPLLLGSIPSILSANRVLITEGTDRSFDPIFFR